MEQLVNFAYNTARTFFNDTFAVKDNGGNYLKINETGITWKGDQGYKYKRGPNSSEKQWIDPED